MLESISFNLLVLVSLYYLQRKGSLEQEIYDRITLSAAVTPTLNGLPKIHRGLSLPPGFGFN